MILKNEYLLLLTLIVVGTITGLISLRDAMNADLKAVSEEIPQLRRQLAPPPIEHKKKIDRATEEVLQVPVD